jgi:hypothetical protein
MAREIDWRKDIGSLNYLETSTWTRQEHNGVPVFVPKSQENMFIFRLYSSHTKTRRSSVLFSTSKQNMPESTYLLTSTV